MVLSSGQVVNANAKSNPDLFKALKGGSSNFGVVTRFDLKTFKQEKLWGDIIAYPYSATTKLVQCLQNFMTALGKDADDYASWS